MGGKVRAIPLETYVRGVVGAEMPASWPEAALEAQAVASRTYALTDHAGGARFDVYADTRSQVYLGTRAQTAQTDAAVAATAGQVVTYNGQPAITYYFASSGGATEDVQNAFPGAAPEPWLVGVADPYDQGPEHSWSVSMSFATAAARLRGLMRGAFRGDRGAEPGLLAAGALGVRGGLGRAHRGERLRTGEPPGPELDVGVLQRAHRPRHAARAGPEPPHRAATDRGSPAGAGQPPTSPGPGPEGGTTAGSSPSAGAGGGTTPP